MGNIVPTEVLFRRSCPQPIGSTIADGRVTDCVGTRLALLLGGFIAFFITFFGARILLPVRAQQCALDVRAASSTPISIFRVATP